MSSEHFTVDGTLLKAWASHKSFKPKDGPPSEPPVGRNAEVGFHGESRSNDTHASTTDPEARLYRKCNNTAATLCFAGHLLMENRNALITHPAHVVTDDRPPSSTNRSVTSRTCGQPIRYRCASPKMFDAFTMGGPSPTANQATLTPSLALAYSIEGRPLMPRPCSRSRYQHLDLSSMPAGRSPRSRRFHQTEPSMPNGSSANRSANENDSGVAAEFPRGSERVRPDDDVQDAYPRPSPTSERFRDRRRCLPFDATREPAIQDSWVGRHRPEFSDKGRVVLASSSSRIWRAIASGSSNELSSDRSTSAISSGSLA